MNDMPPSAPPLWDDVGQYIVWGIGVIMIIALVYFMKLIFSSAGSDDDDEDENSSQK
ncbi:MAG: hypothetical protein OEZ43_16660 [Gammaproteobacteria bacterium]|nr:hypothetical protein [Gammaproteobacteria bacterium]